MDGFRHNQKEEIRYQKGEKKKPHHEPNKKNTTFLAEFEN